MYTLKWHADHSPADRVIYLITEEDVQASAISQVGRRLNDEELRTAKKCVESGLGFGLDVVVSTAIEEAIT